MRTLTTKKRQFWHDARTSAIACTLVACCVMATPGSARAACPWIVQPHSYGQDLASDTTLVNIVFDGLAGQKQFFYGFTVTDIGLAWDLSKDGTLTELGPNGRALDVTETNVGPAFEVHAESIEPHTVYLVAARSPVGELENLGAAIEPSQPFNVSFAKTRGASDFSGPLPARSLPGVEIRASKSRDEVSQWLTLVDQKLRLDQESPDNLPGSETKLASNEIVSTPKAPGKEDVVRHDVQICAYQVAMR